MPGTPWSGSRRWISLLLGAIFLALVIREVRTGGFDDLDGPAHRMIFDDDDVPEHPGED